MTVKDEEFKKELELDERRHLTEIASKNAIIILKEFGLKETDQKYSHRLIELQFKIYRELKKCNN